MEKLDKNAEVIGRLLESTLEDDVVDQIIIANLTRSYDNLSQWVKLRPSGAVEEEEIYMEDISNVLSWYLSEEEHKQWFKERKAHAQQFTQEALL
jgi:hypothetical protein